jgi:hypothetical protein
MENFMKENWFKIGILLVAVIGLITISGRSNVDKTVPKNETLDKNSFLIAKQCREDGEKILQNDIDAATMLRQQTDIVECFYEKPEYIFNHDLNTCLYFGGYSCKLTKLHEEGFLKGTNATRWKQHVLDVYSNKTLASIFVEDSSAVDDLKGNMIDEFFKESEQLGF